MKHGSLPWRIVHSLEKRRQRYFRTGHLVGRFGSKQSVSRALGRLRDDGIIEQLDRGLYRVVPGKAPSLVFDRAWSNPGTEFPPDKLIAVTMGRPTFRDTIRLCHAYGVSRVHHVLAELKSSGDVDVKIADEWIHRLETIKQAFQNVAKRQVAAGHGRPAR